MLAAALLSLGVVFLAELGDRSQLITMAYALRYQWWVVLPGVALAAFLAHGVSVTIGHFVGAVLPARPMAFASAIAFLIFAVWAWREGAAADRTVPTTHEQRFALLSVVSSFALAEMSDKTTLATVTLASERDWAGVWIGSTHPGHGLGRRPGDCCRRTAESAASRAASAQLGQRAVPYVRDLDVVRRRTGLAFGRDHRDRGGGADGGDFGGAASATPPN